MTYNKTVVNRAVTLCVDMTYKTVVNEPKNLNPLQLFVRVAL